MAGRLSFLGGPGALVGGPWYAGPMTNPENDQTPAPIPAEVSPAADDALPHAQEQVGVVEHLDGTTEVGTITDRPAPPAAQGGSE